MSIIILIIGSSSCTHISVPACEELCALISAKYDELHDECAGPYYQYATALLEIAREENQVRDHVT